MRLAETGRGNRLQRAFRTGFARPVPIFETEVAAVILILWASAALSSGQSLQGNDERERSEETQPKQLPLRPGVDFFAIFIPTWP